MSHTFVEPRPGIDHDPDNHPTMALTLTLALSVTPTIILAMALTLTLTLTMTVTIILGRGSDTHPGTDRDPNNHPGPWL